jgi:hypothetical protein
VSVGLWNFILRIFIRTSPTYRIAHYHEQAGRWK